MAKIVIKKKISLEFLGDDYKESYLVFRTISFKEYEELVPKLDDAASDGVKSAKTIKDVLEKNFIEGKFQGEDVVKEDLGDLDLNTLARSFELLTGQVTDPKV